MMSNCDKCGFQLSEKADFCPNCGLHVNRKNKNVQPTKNSVITFFELGFLECVLISVEHELRV